MVLQVKVLDRLIWTKLLVLESVLQILLDREVFEEKLEHNLEEKNRMFEKFYETDGFTLEEILEEYYGYGQEIAQVRYRYF